MRSCSIPGSRDSGRAPPPAICHSVLRSCSIPGSRDPAGLPQSPISTIWRQPARCRSVLRPCSLFGSRDFARAPLCHLKAAPPVPVSLASLQHPPQSARMGRLAAGWLPSHWQDCVGCQAHWDWRHQDLFMSAGLPVRRLAKRLMAPKSVRFVQPILQESSQPSRFRRLLAPTPVSFGRLLDDWLCQSARFGWLPFQESASRPDFDDLWHQSQFTSTGSLFRKPTKRRYFNDLDRLPFREVMPDVMISCIQRASLLQDLARSRHLFDAP